MKDFKKGLAQALEKAVPELRLEEAERLLECPPDKSMGDFALPCFKLAGILKKPPAVIAQELQARIKLPSGFESAKVSGPYLNFFLEQASLAQSSFSEALKLKAKFGFSSTGKGKKVMVEFVSPNSNKPLHIGHLRNMFLGESFSRLFETQGFKVIRANLINDRGVHICKSMLAFEKWGKGSTPKKAGRKSDHFVGDYYVMFSKKAAENPELEQEALQMLNAWEKGNKEVLKLWETMSDWALEGMQQTYKKCGISFDKYYKESAIYTKGRDIILEGLKKGVFSKDETGAIVADLEPYKLGKKVLLRADGTSIYMTQDLYLAKKKFEDFKGLSESLVVTANEQDLHFRQLLKILELLGLDFASRFRHISYGYIGLPSGRMKSREGTVVDADDLIAELESLSQAELVKRYPEILQKELAKRKEAIALAALKFHLLKVEAQKDFVFNPAESISFEGETGPYVLYSIARAKSILRKAQKSLLSGKPDFALLKLESEKELASIVSKFPETLQQSLKNYSPHVLCHYSLKLAAAFNSYYHETPVLNAESPQASKARIALVKSVGQVLENCLETLGIECLDEM